MSAVRGSRMVFRYPIKDECLRQTTSMGNTQRLQIGAPDLEFREDLLVNLRNIDRPMQNGIGGRTRWGDAETYGETRQPKKGSFYIGKWRNDLRGSFL